MELEYLCAPDFWLGFLLSKELVCSTSMPLFSVAHQPNHYYMTYYNPVKMNPVNK